MKTLLIALLLFIAVGCSEKEDLNDLGCGTGIDDAGSRVLVKCLTKAQFNNRANIKDPVTTKSIFDPYTDVQWELCQNCK
jgi:hypothetical protein